jgi:hypothetical protein
MSTRDYVADPGDGYSIFEDRKGFGTNMNDHDVYHELR